MNFFSLNVNITFCCKCDYIIWNRTQLLGDEVLKFDMNSFGLTSRKLELNERRSTPTSNNEHTRFTCTGQIKHGLSCIPTSYIPVFHIRGYIIRKSVHGPQTTTKSVSRKEKTMTKLLNCTCRCRIGI